MQIERLSLVVRPRNPWEALDLGVRMVQQWAFTLYQMWLLVFVPVVLLCYGVSAGNIELTWILVLWLKPLYDRVLLHYLSHAVFGENPSVRQSLRALPSLWFNLSACSALTLRRFDAARSFNLPIDQLEGLHGKARKIRLRILNQKTGSTAQLLTTICVSLESILYLSAFALLYFMLPQQYAHQSWFDQLIHFQPPEITNLIFYSLAVAFLEPFYVACGFALYLNRRTQLEAWDIELDFRRLAHRLQQAGLGLFVGVVLVISSFAPTTSQADEVKAARTVDEVKVDINQVMQQPELSRQQIVWGWREIDETKSEKNTQPDENKVLSYWLRGQVWRDLLLNFATLIKFFLWLTLLVLFLYFVPRWLLNTFPGAFSRSQPPTDIPPIFFNETGELDFPKDIPQQVWTRWRAGQVQQALSLLYRGALYHVQTEQHVSISRSMTESECLALIKTNPSIYPYLTQIIQIWLGFAYAHRMPQHAEIETICQTWSEHFQHV